MNLSIPILKFSPHKEAPELARFLARPAIDPAAEETARRTADAAARTTAIGAFWAFAALLLGLGAAVLGARSGTHPGRVVMARRRDALRA